MNRKYQKAFTLLEVLVALVILSIGLLGLAGMQLTGMRFNKDSSFRTLAVNQAAELIDILRVNPDVVTSFVDSDNNLVVDADKTVTHDIPTSTTTLSGLDTALSDWATATEALLPNSKKDLSLDQSDKLLTITITWDDSVYIAETTAGNTSIRPSYPLRFKPDGIESFD